MTERMRLMRDAAEQAGFGNRFRKLELAVSLMIHGLTKKILWLVLIAQKHEKTDTGQRKEPVSISATAISVAMSTHAIR
jgi:hypothetical protein